MLRTFAAVSLLSQGALAGLYPGLSPMNHTCALQTPILSCSDQAQPGLVDTCCVETYGGLVLQTQYWNTYTGMEEKGQVLPKDSWTIHGLWPDFCNGSYTQYCDLSRQFDPEPYPTTTNGEPDGTPVPPWTGEPIFKLISKFGRNDLLEYMRKYWIGLDQWSWVLWAHEFSKHATCFSTFDVECKGPEYVEHSEIVEYFETTVSYFQNVPSWGWLSAAGIRPSNVSAYSLSDIQAALVSGFGDLPFIGCGGPAYNETEAGKGSDDDGATELNELWYYFHTYGRPQRVQGVPVGAGSYNTTCAKAPYAIKYYERTPGSVA